MMNAPPDTDKFGHEPIRCSECDKQYTMKTITMHPETGRPLCMTCFTGLAKNFSLGGDDLR